MSLLLTAEKIMMLQIPGTASSALEQTVLSLPGGASVGAKHATVPELRGAGLLPPADDGPLEVVCMVRNHFDLLHAEWYRSRTRWIMEIDKPHSVGSWPERKRLMIKMCAVKEFSDYLLWSHEQEIAADRKLFMYAGYADHCTRVFRMEDMAAFQAWLSGRIGRPIELPRYNVTQKARPYWMDYTREARELVTRLYRDELDLYGYVF